MRIRNGGKNDRHKGAAMTFCETRDGTLIPVARIASIGPAREQNPWRLLRTLDGAEYEIGADQCDEVGQMIPAQPGFAAVMKRHSRFGKKIDWIELEPVVGWLLSPSGRLSPVTVKHGSNTVHDAILTPDGTVVDIHGTHASLAEWKIYREGGPAEPADFLSTNIEDVVEWSGTAIGTRIINVCKDFYSSKNGPCPIITIADLIAQTERDFSLQPNVGRKAVNNVKEVLRKHGLQFNGA
jgi:hypothetical protein